MKNNSRLIEHYDKKYRYQNYTSFKPIPIVRHPKNRFEMASLIS